MRNNYTLKKILIFILLFAIIIFLVLDVCIGSTYISVDEVGYALFHKNDEAKVATILWKIRLPMSFMAVNIGIALGISGACMQTILNNSLASPYTLGVSASAGFGAALAILTGWFSNTIFSKYVSSIFAVVVAMLVSATIYIFSKKSLFSKKSIILSGIALMFLFQSLQSLLQFISDSDTMQNIVFWNLGSLTKADWSKVFIMTMLNILLVPLIEKEAWNLTALRLGDVEAKSIGIDVGHIRIKCYVYISILTAVSVSFVGAIGFIGIAAPHIARTLFGDDQRYYLIISGMVGAILLSISSILSKIIIPGIVFPIGIITCMIGVPFFILIVFRGDRSIDSGI